MDKELKTVGVAHSDITDVAAAPKQGNEGGVTAFIEIFPEFRPALDGLQENMEIHLFTWLHQADRRYLQVHPRGDANKPKRGVFATRSPDWPNPIGMHTVRIVKMREDGMEVEPLEAVDGTPVVDVKPPVKAAKKLHGLAGQEQTRDWGENIPADAAETMRRVCGRAWERGLFSGLNGNMSVRAGNVVCVTNRGVAKGNLQPGDLVCLDPETGRKLSPGRPSSEVGVHLAVYDQVPAAWAVLHTHPAHLLALHMKVGDDDFLQFEMFEADLLRAELAMVPALQPGSEALAQAVGKAARNKRAVYMRGHGLVCWGEQAEDALALSEELDFLARVQLMALR